MDTTLKKARSREYPAISHRKAVEFAGEFTKRIGGQKLLPSPPSIWDMLG
jgi:hypothetical protein